MLGVAFNIEIEPSMTRGWPAPNIKKGTFNLKLAVRDLANTREEVTALDSSPD